jgi:hypothetical protein
MELKGFQAWILVDGQEVNQYGVETKENKTTCWIPSEAGKVGRLSRSQSSDCKGLLTTIAEVHSEMERFSTTSGCGNRWLRVS